MVHKYVLKFTTFFTLGKGLGLYIRDKPHINYNILKKKPKKILIYLFVQKI